MGEVTREGAGDEAELVCLFKELKLETSCQPDVDSQVRTFVCLVA